MGSWQYKYFTYAELACHHCGECHMDPSFMFKMDQKIRPAFGRPIVVTSGYRCPEYNNNISGTGPGGPHTTGRALNVKVYGADAVDLIEICLRHGVRRFGPKQHGTHGERYLHIDDIGQWLWTYP